MRKESSIVLLVIFLLSNIAFHSLLRVVTLWELNTVLLVVIGFEAASIAIGTVLIPMTSSTHVQLAQIKRTRAAGILQLLSFLVIVVNMILLSMALVLVFGTGRAEFDGLAVNVTADLLYT
jgi:hypothetical protein